MNQMQTITLDGSSLDGLPPTEPAHILVLDDQFAIRSLIDEVLSANNYKVTQARNLAEAEEFVHKQVFDAVIVDIFLNERESGLSLLPRIREVQPHTPTIVISGMASMDNVMEALKAGAYDMITKPFNIMDMLHVVARAVEKKRMSDENERLVEALRHERDMLEERVKAATSDLKATIESLRKLNEQMATMFEMGQARLEDASSESMIHSIFNVLKRSIDFEGAFCVVYDIKAQGISLAHADGDEAAHEFCDQMRELFRVEGKNLAESSGDSDRLSPEELHVRLQELYPGRWPENEFMLMPLHVPATLMGIAGLLRRKSTSRLAHTEQRMLGLAIAHFLAGFEQRNFILRTGQLAGLGELIAEIAHDLRNPMTSLRGASRMLVDGWQDDAKRTRCLDEIASNLGRMESLVSELVNFYNPKEMNIVSVELHELLDKSLQVSNSLIEQKSIEVHRSYAPERIMILGLTRNLIEAFINLISNACQAMPWQGGRLSVSTEFSLATHHCDELRQVGRNPGAYVCVSISDNGCGIPEDNKDKIFRRFFTTRPEGHGLGLPAVMRICKKNLGHIRMDSQVGVGTTFHFYLPKA